MDDGSTTVAGLRRQDCELCNSLVDFDGHRPTKKEKHWFFHGECATCAPAVESEQLLCSFCQHLRIRHLLACELRNPDLKVFSCLSVVVNLDLERGQPRTCPSCHLFMCMFAMSFVCIPRHAYGISSSSQGAQLALRKVNDRGEGGAFTSLEFLSGLVRFPIMCPDARCRQRMKYIHQAYLAVSRMKWFVRWLARNAIPACLNAEKRRNFIYELPFQMRMTIFRIDTNPRVRLEDFLPGEVVRWDLIKKALRNCDSKHATCLERPLGAPPLGFTLIDVHKRQLFDPKRWRPFIALSYVWGNPENSDPKRLKAERSTMDELKKIGGIAASKIPRTIDDAIQVCKILGQRYLWVDRLCVVQDDREQTMRQVNVMDQIYRSAYLVLVVTEGDMESGIPGIRRKRPRPEQTNVAGQRLAQGHLSLETAVDQSRWATRGWTYQEVVLAKRKLFLTPLQAYLECEREVIGECAAQYSTRNFTGLFHFSHPRWKKAECMPPHSSLDWDWGHHLVQYTKRYLTNPLDIYNAFQGVSHAIYGGEGGILYGLPRADFDLALLWYCQSTHSSSSYAFRTTKNESLRLPSWSWASLQREVASPSRFMTRFRETLVGWIHISDTVPHDLVGAREWKRSLSRNTFTAYPKWPWKASQFYLAVAWSQGCIDSPWPLKALDAITFNSLREEIDHKWSEFPDRLARSLFLPENELKRMNDDINVCQLHPGVLVARAQTAGFGLLQHQHHKFPHKLPVEHDLLEIIDEGGHCVGMLLRREPLVDAEVLSRLVDSPLFEFVALSIGSFDYSNAALNCLFQQDQDSPEDMSANQLSLYRKSQTLDLTLFDSAGEPLSGVPVVNVMLIGRLGHLVHRISIGWILLTKWAKAKREFKMIYLE